MASCPPRPTAPAAAATAAARPVRPPPAASGGQPLIHHRGKFQSLFHHGSVYARPGQTRPASSPRTGWRFRAITIMTVRPPAVGPEAPDRCPTEAARNAFWRTGRDALRWPIPGPNSLASRVLEYWWPLPLQSSASPFSPGARSGLPGPLLPRVQTSRLRVRRGGPGEARGDTRALGRDDSVGRRARALKGLEVLDAELK